MVLVSILAISCSVCLTYFLLAILRDLGVIINWIQWWLILIIHGKIIFTRILLWRHTGNALTSSSFILLKSSILWIFLSTFIQVLGVLAMISSPFEDGFIWILSLNWLSSIGRTRSRITYGIHVLLKMVCTYAAASLVKDIALSSFGTIILLTRDKWLAVLLGGEVERVLVYNLLGLLVLLVLDGQRLHELVAKIGLFVSS